MTPEDELISKLKAEIGKSLPAMFSAMAENMLENNKEVIIKWLVDNKDLVKQVIDK
ncbi:MAG: hypothetical protein NWF03_02480 [Candidatus Bathyarchaeota archaeon]|nr:hypothetical protein [Candidatus Bathyarchaeota archaeon]